jgi:hypothetical protein
LVGKRLIEGGVVRVDGHGGLPLFGVGVTQFFGSCSWLFFAAYLSQRLHVLIELHLDGGLNREPL